MTSSMSVTPTTAPRKSALTVTWYACWAARKSCTRRASSRSAAWTREGRGEVRFRALGFFAAGFLLRLPNPRKHHAVEVVLGGIGSGDVGPHHRDVGPHHRSVTSTTSATSTARRDATSTARRDTTTNTARRDTTTNTATSAATSATPSEATNRRDAASAATRRAQNAISQHFYLTLRLHERTDLSLRVRDQLTEADRC